MQKLDGMVNNFNAVMLRAGRCNMDIKFIGSGGLAKAALYYITDYISKAQLKAHVAYAGEVPSESSKETNANARSSCCDDDVSPTNLCVSTSKPLPNTNKQQSSSFGVSRADTPCAPPLRMATSSLPHD